MTVADIVEVIVIGILGHSSVEVCPRENVLGSLSEQVQCGTIKTTPTIASCLFSMVFTAISARK